MPDEAPVTPDTPNSLFSIFELAEILRPSWGSINRRLDASGVPLNRVEPEGETAPPAEGTPPPEQSAVNWEQRYNDLRPTFDRTAQEAASLRAWQESIKTDPAAQRQLLEELGYEFDEEPQGPPQPGDDIRAELEALKAQNADLQQWRDGLTEQQQIDALQNAADAEFKRLGYNADDPDDAEMIGWLEAKALGLPALADGRLDIEGAHKALGEWENKRQQKWATSKKAPAVPRNGSAGNQVPNLDNDADRRAYMAQQLEAMNAGG